MASTPIRFVVYVAIGAVAVAAASPVAAAQVAGIGAKYDSRDPAKCATLTEPKTKGPPSNAQVAQYVKCTMEGESGGDLYLVENLNVQIAPQGRPYSRNVDSATDIDIKVPIYAIRGSFVQYLCTTPGGYFSPKGQNCTTFDQPKATGNCYKSTFGEWNCAMSDINTRTQTSKVAPPK